MPVPIVVPFHLRKAKALALFAGLLGFFVLPAPAKDFGDPGSVLVMGQGNFNRTVTREPSSDGDPGYRSAYFGFLTELRGGIFVAPGFFIGPSEQFLYRKFEGGSASTIQNLGGFIGGAIPIPETPLVPYFGGSPFWSHRKTKYSSSLASESTADGFSYSLFAGLMLRFGHLGIPVEISYTRSNLDETKSYAFDVKFGFAGLF